MRISLWSHSHIEQLISPFGKNNDAAFPVSYSYLA